MNGFSQDLFGDIGQEMEIVPFHAPLAFFHIPYSQTARIMEDNSDENDTTVLVYCYFCPHLKIENAICRHARLTLRTPSNFIITLSARRQNETRYHRSLHANYNDNELHLK